MEVLVDQRESVQNHTGGLRGVGQLRHKALAAIAAPEDLRSAVAAAGNMIDGIRKIDPWWARHVARIPSSTPNCKPYSTKRKPDPVRGTPSVDPVRAVRAFVREHDRHDLPVSLLP